MATGEDVVSDLAAGTDWVLWEGVSMGRRVRQVQWLCCVFQYVGVGRGGVEGVAGMSCADDVSSHGALT